VAAALRPDDPAFLHYRSGAFFLARGAAGLRRASTPRGPARAHRREGRSDLRRAATRCSAAFSSRFLPRRPPSPRTCPKAVGGRVHAGPRLAPLAGHAGPARGHRRLQLRRRLGEPLHPLAGAINTACWASFQQLPVPILFICEDNGLGISVRLACRMGGGQPLGAAWPPLLRRRRSRPLAESFEVASEGRALRGARRGGRRSFHLKVRAPARAPREADEEGRAYRSTAEIEGGRGRRSPAPLRAGLLIESGNPDPGARAARLVRGHAGARVAALSPARAARRPRPRIRAEEIVAPARARATPDAVAERGGGARPIQQRRAAFWNGRPCPRAKKPAHLAEQINRGARRSAGEGFPSCSSSARTWR